MTQGRNPHAGERFTDSDEVIAAALADVSVPALLCSLVHMTGDPSWIRGPWRPRLANSLDLQYGMPPEEQAEVRARALPAIAAYRDGGCEPHELDKSLLLEMMTFLATQLEVTEQVAALFFDDLAFDGADSGAVTWRDQIDPAVRADSPVVVIGCGLGGILAGIRLRQAGLPFVILDKNEAPGGTWWENRYPGARVDIGSHQYCYSFEPSHHWSEYFCQQPELRDYFISMVEKYELGPYCRFGVTVTQLAWDDETGRWRVHTRAADGTEEVLDARFVISAVGSLNIPKMPDIPGMETFTGPSFHSARWPADLARTDLAGKRFALVGAGASGFQLGPAVAEHVEQLTIYQRTAQWIIPNPLYHQPVPPGAQWASLHLPFYGRWFRFITTFPGIALGNKPYRIDPNHVDTTNRSINPTNAHRAELLIGWMKSILADRPDLLDKVIPDYPVAGKRILQDDGTWLRTLKRPNVELVRTGIDHIEPDGIVTTDGVHRPADIICYATGFRHNDFLASMHVTGREGVSLRAMWGDEPTAYLGITIPKFPNLFCVYGPGTNLAAGASLFYHSEFQVHYAMEAIRETLASGARVCEVRQEPHDDYVERTQAELRQLVWGHPSIRHSHYKNPAGRVYTLSPWPLELYWEWTRRVDTAHYIFT
ncbi:MAG: NAD(P)/FAD-dependent oxidoreductase [Frankia sp.]|nr:NAD(P)/FAD-dependent oxidoreductase [Frankia sp.]